MDSIGSNDGERCQVCGERYLTVWYADDKLWTKVTGVTDESGLWCPHCFSREARAKGIVARWSCAEEWSNLTDIGTLQSALAAAQKRIEKTEEEAEGDIRRIDEGWDHRCGELERALDASRLETKAAESALTEANAELDREQDGERPLPLLVEKNALGNELRTTQMHLTVAENKLVARDETIVALEGEVGRFACMRETLRQISVQPCDPSRHGDGSVCSPCHAKSYFESEANDQKV